MANFMQMMQKASQMKQKMQDMQERLQEMEMDGTAGGGKVTCRITGKFELKQLKIDPSIVNASDVELLEDMVVVAVNDARAKVEKMMGDETEKIMGEMGLPKGMGLPF